MLVKITNATLASMTSFLDATSTAKAVCLPTYLGVTLVESLNYGFN